VIDQLSIARLRLVTAMLSMPDNGAYGVIRTARIDLMAGRPLAAPLGRLRAATSLRGPFPPGPRSARATRRLSFHP